MLQYFLLFLIWSGLVVETHSLCADTNCPKVNSCWSWNHFFSIPSVSHSFSRLPVPYHNSIASTIFPIAFNFYFNIPESSFTPSNRKLRITCEKNVILHRIAAFLQLLINHIVLSKLEASNHKWSNEDLTLSFPMRLECPTLYPQMLHW